ncbi:undecaprenyldiphospho-muramoylpentapeptide beta-N-acetylglucosaminyltransferase [Neolewinella antarctica]|uniref:UDP-N-acetylglucosamine--N-acetylmuramyl-(pentapeptide) pyrophosphoryl-undecaprenol N-acetylglucosamine transferase n=1 Tax=Neolewinella antarctica TaxID=442734 RepID=A0ABX0X805_9BACT|nr:undecaprenyldiphospho-muramoylpentapeptide beta-N-acetylglucosaminyltransferase [Neolewinella antarctica]NJC25282.1 UDP-N-acetylglucosamine--N-acetylmuramyl-(pentapeptide) pyrophosphoryl-undecaprenol N-acetylglucosamine transferase [Neolewinella antarctica]
MQRKSSINNEPLRIIVSGGGTGGHIFPAIAIADELKRLRPGSEFLFVGAKGKMEMEKVPKAGYEIVGLPIRGLQRKLTLENLGFPFKVIASLLLSRRIIKQFRPDVVIGTGGYAGAPVLYVAAKMGVLTLIQEPNAFAGLANKWLGKQVDKICVAFPGMEQFFPATKLVHTGNPVREDMLKEAAKSRPDSSVNHDRPCVLLMGGSGGAKSLNEAMRAGTELIRARPRVQWRWQCGKYYEAEYETCDTAKLPNVTMSAFIDDMAKAYAAADVVIARAGSTTIAEIQYLGKPAILVPSPWVAEDHQTKNAEVLALKSAALLIPDAETGERLVKETLLFLDDAQAPFVTGQNAKAMAQPGAVTRIAEEVLKLIATKPAQS